MSLYAFNPSSSPLQRLPLGTYPSAQLNSGNSFNSSIFLPQPNSQQYPQQNVAIHPTRHHSDKLPLLKHLLKALGWIATGFLLHRLPAHSSRFELLSSDWKDWAKIALGVQAVGEINQSVPSSKQGSPTLQPKPWQLALETVTLITLLSQGLSKKGWRNFPLLALFVPILVEGTRDLNDFIQQKSQNHHEIPQWLSKLAISLGSTLFGILALRKIIQSPHYSRLMGNNSSQGSGEMISSQALMCGRCGGAHLVCMDEIGELLGGLWAWLTVNQNKE